MLTNTSHSSLSVTDAENIAIRALGFLASEPDHLARFMSLTGMEPDDIASNAGSAQFQIALLDHLMSDEALLLTFCGNENIDPQFIAPAHHLLTGEQSCGNAHRD